MLSAQEVAAVQAATWMHNTWAKVGADGEILERHPAMALAAERGVRFRVRRGVLEPLNDDHDARLWSAVEDLSVQLGFRHIDAFLTLIQNDPQTCRALIAELVGSAA